MPYVRVTYVQATFVQQYILCAWSNFHQTICTHFFGGQAFFSTKNQTFFKPKVFWIQIFLEPIYFWTQIFLTKIFEIQNFGRPFFILFFLWTKKFWEPKFFYTKNVFDPIFFNPPNLFGPNYFLTQNHLTQNLVEQKFWASTQFNSTSNQTKAEVSFILR